MDEDVDDALNPFTDRPEPVRVSGAAHKRLASMVRRWSGWDRGSLRFEQMDEGRIAHVDHVEQSMTVDIDRLLLNPNRVLMTVTPFRLRQEAVLTGVLLHETGHTLYSKWPPRTPEALAEMKHGDGTPVEAETLKFAKVLEEPRVERRVAQNAGKMGAAHLSWTMRAAAAHLLPPTELSSDPSQRVMDLVEAWVKRAGRAYAYADAMSEPVPKWVSQFDLLVEDEVLAHLESLEDNPDSDYKGDPFADAGTVMSILQRLPRVEDDEGTTVLDAAKTLLDLLFEHDPNAPGGGSGGGCSSMTAPSEGEGDVDSDSDLAKALAKAEATAEEAEKDEAESQAKSAPESEDPKDDKPARQGQQGGSGSEVFDGVWRKPTPEEHGLKRGAERVLRAVVEPTERAVTRLSESPAATVDPAALAAWKAGGQVKEPRFFKRTKREVIPAPPVRVAILVDVSESMDTMQEPSAFLSWALASAALDLRNFAGQGTSVESCLIHWGNAARTIQQPGELLPGIRTVACNEGTREEAMADALLKADQMMPGFLDNPTGKPENRLIVQFTDWQLSGGQNVAKPDHPVQRALASGARMLSISPNQLGMGGWWDVYPLVADHPNTRAVVYGGNEEQVWDEAARLLRT